MPWQRSWIAPALMLAVVSGMWWIHAEVYRRFLSDDALISLRYARRFVEGKGLTWNDGERVEGYTDFLWVLLNAAGGRLGCDYIAVALALDRAGVLAAVVVIGLSPRVGRLSAVRLLAGGGLLALSVPMAVWSNGGLEHGFMSGVLSLGLYLLSAQAYRPVGRGIVNSAYLAGIPFAALALLRADGVVLGAFALVGVWLAEGRRWSRASFAQLFPTGLPVGVAVLGQLVFRRLYYGQWQPNTAVAKLAFNRGRLILGARHLAAGYLAIAVLLVLAVVATFSFYRQRRDGGLDARPRPMRRALCISWAVVVGWSIYLGVVGGDIFPGWRQLLLVLPPLAFIVAEAAETFSATMKAGPRRRWFIFATVGCLGLHLVAQQADSENRRAGNELWEWDGVGAAATLKRAFGSRRPLLAVDAAGALPYWSDFPALDMLGLNDAFIAHHPPRDFGRGPIGHELGDGAYVWRRAPDLIAFDNASGSHDPRFLSGRQLLAMPPFHRVYQWIRLRPDSGNRALAELWVRREEGKLGVTRAADRIEVPGYFLTGQESDAEARASAPHGDGVLVAVVTAQKPGILPALEIPAGRWRLRVMTSAEPGGAPAPGLLIDPRCRGRSMQRLGATPTVGMGRPGAAVILDLDEASPVGFGVAPDDRNETAPAEVRIESMILERAEGGTVSHRCLAAGEPLFTTSTDTALSSRPRENAFWSHPSHVVLGPEGLVIRVQGSQRLGALDLSADGNDDYRLTVTRAGHPIWNGVGPVVANGGGLAHRHVEVSPAIDLQVGDEITVAPTDGDRAYSVGYLHLEP